MAFEVPVPRSYQATLGDIISTFQARAGISQLKVGGAILTAFEAAAQSDVRSTQDVFNTLDLEDYGRLRGSALDFKGRSKGLERGPATPSTGTVDISDTRFTKISSRVYSGTPPPPAGSTIVRVANALLFPASGQIYLGRGTVNNEGPLSYTAKTSFGQYWQLTLSAPTQKFHNVNEEVVVGQGGNRAIPIGTAVSTTRDGRTTPVDFQTTTAAIILDGETIVRNVGVSCQQPGVIGNVPFNAIRAFSSQPFPGATVANPSSFNNGLDAQSDDEYVESLRKFEASKSRGTETAIYAGVQNQFSTEESKRVISASLVRPAGEPAVLYIDDGSGYEEKNTGIANDILVDSASGGEQYFSLSARRPIAKAFVKTGFVGPFTLQSGCVLAVMVGGVLNEHSFTVDDFLAISSATPQEIVSSINGNPNISFSARTADNSTRVAIFARADIGEDLEVVQPNGVTDANDFLSFSTSPTYTLKLYKNDILLYKDGREAVITGAAQSLWTSITDGVRLTVAVDGTPAVTYTFNDSDFVLQETGYSSVSQTNSVASWVKVINAKIPGITASDGGGFILLKSNRGRLSTASIVLTAPGGANLISAGMFTSVLGLSSTGLNRDYTLDRMTGQLKLSVPLVAGDALTVGSTQTRAYVQSAQHSSGVITLTDLARLWVSVNGQAERIRVNTTASTLWTTSVSDDDRVQYSVDTTTAFGSSTCLLQVGDFVVIWDSSMKAHGAFRICEVPTTAPFNWFVAERPGTIADITNVTLTADGVRFFRLSGATIQEVRLAAGTNRSLSNIADEINTQLADAKASVYRNVYLRLTTNDYRAAIGDITVLTADTAGQNLLFPLAQTDVSVLSHLPYIQSRNEVGTPWFASSCFVQDIAGDLFDAGTDTLLAMELAGTSNLADSGQLLYFMRRVQNAVTDDSRFGTGTDHHFPILNSAFTSLTRMTLRKNDIPLVLDSLVRSSGVVRATVSAGHRYVVGDIVWVMQQSTATAGFNSNTYAVTAVTPTTFSYVEAGSNGTATTVYTSNLWDGTQYGNPTQDGDGVVLTSPYALTPRDSLNFTLNNDETNQAYSVPMRRRLKPVTTSYQQATDIEVVDFDNSSAPLSDLFGDEDPVYFADFWAFMRSRTISHKNSANKAILWRSTRFGPENDAFRISYVNPRIGDTNLAFGTEFMSDRTFNIYLYLPHDTARSGLSLQASTRFTWTVSTVGSSGTPGYHKVVAYAWSNPNCNLTKSGTTVTATTAGSVPHGLSVGDTVYITATTDNTYYPNGAKIITAVGGGGTTFTYTDVSGGTTATANASSASAPPDFTNVSVGDIAIIGDDGTCEIDPAGSWRVYAKTSTGFTIWVPGGSSITTQTTPARIGTLANLQFAPIKTTTAAQAQAFVNGTDDIKDIIGGTLLGDGSSDLDTSTQDEFMQATPNTSIPTPLTAASVARWTFTDGLNYVLTSDLAVNPNTLQFKAAPSTVELQSSCDFLNEEIQLVPVTAKSVAKWLATPAISGAYVTTDFEVVGRDHCVQATSRIQGTTGGVQVTGGLSNATQIVLLGSGENYQSSYGRLIADTDDTAGLTGKQWVALTNADPTLKTLPVINTDKIALATNGTITITTSSSAARPLWIRDASAVVSSGNHVTIQKVGSFIAYIFQVSASLPAECAVGNWIDFQIPAANSSNRGRRRIVGTTTVSSYKIVWVENPNGLSEIVKATGDEVEFYTADSVLPGDTIELGWSVGGFANNQGSYVVTALGATNNAVVVEKAFTAVAATTIGSNLTALRVSEPAFRLVERLDFVAPVPNDFTRSYLALVPQASKSLLDRLNPTLGGTLTVLDKLGFPNDPAIGVDGYAISTGLIGQVTKVLYGDPNSPTLYPGLVAVGGTVFVSGPNVKRVRVSMQIRIRTGVPQTTLVERVRSAVASEINRVPLGTAVDISRIVAAARRVQGVVSVVILSPVYSVGNDSIAVQANEKPFVFSPQDDIAVTVVT